ncbi:MAG: DNA polymerase I [Actinobacteria bacterium]|nr:DNA polymerase I [Actinomycetota bacterium]
MASRLLLIDGHSMAYRAFYALPAENFTTATGQHTNAIYGFATMLISLLKEEKPTHVAVAFDVSRKTFRTEKFPEYKANRAKTPDEFRSQMSLLHDLVKGFGISQFEVEGFEADDILATLTSLAEREGVDVIICTGDRDSFQLVSEKTTVLYPKRGVSDLARMTPEAVFEKYGLTPQNYPDFAALRGDPSDNLPSIPGVGEKTASKWIIEHGSLQALVDGAGKIPGKVGESLRANIQVALTNRELTQLIHDVPLDVSMESLAWSGVSESALTPLFEKLEFRTLKERIKPILAQSAIAPDDENQEAMLFVDQESEVLTPEEAAERISNHIGPISFNAEFIDGALHRYGVALTSSQAFLVHSSQVGDWIADSKIPKILHDAKAFGRNHVLDGVIFDTSLASYLVNPGARPQDITEWDGNTFLQAEKLFSLRDSLTVELTDRNLLALFHDLEMPVSELLTAMERRGIAVDAGALTELREFFASEVERETKKAHEEAGREFNVASPKQLQVVLFDELKLPKTKKIKTGYSTDADSLQTLFEKTQHPVLNQLLRIRETNKLKTTIDGLLEAIDTDGRIRTHFQQMVAATGRLSSTGPNLQNIPVRTQEGRKIRECFIAGTGFQSLLTADYSQIEMRIMAHLSDDQNLLDAFTKGEDLHSTIASEVFGVPAGSVDPEMRRQIKAMSYGLAYGLSAYGLSAQLSISPPQAQQLMDRYFERFGGIRDYLSSVVEEARKVGYTETIMGRRRYLPDLSDDNRQRREIAERMALNAPIQGSAADIIKRAMLNVESAIQGEGLKSRLLLQVHDELICEVAPGEDEVLTALMRKEMGSAYPLKAPLAVSVGIGKSWNEAAH